MGEAADRAELGLARILDCESRFVFQKEPLELFPVNYFLTFILRVKPEGLARCDVRVRCK